MFLLLLLAVVLSWLCYFKPLLGWDDYWQNPEWDPPVAYEVAELDAKEFSKLLSQLTELKKDSDKDYKKHEEKTIQIVENLSSSSSNSEKQPAVTKEIEIEDLNQKPNEEKSSEQEIAKVEEKQEENNGENIVQEKQKVQEEDEDSK